MQRFRAGSFTFSAPSSWDEVTLGQFMTLMESDNSPSAIISTLLAQSEAELWSQQAPFDTSLFILSHLSFINTLPDVSETLPTHVTISGRSIKLPKDLGAECTLGQMWDVQFVIASREKDKEAITPMSMAKPLLTVFLWPLLSEKPYTSRSEAAELWTEISSLPCTVGLNMAAFFLRNSINPLPSGRISILPPQKTPLKSWLTDRFPALQRLTNILPPSS